MYNSGLQGSQPIKMNRAQRRIDVGINKRGIHKPKEGRTMAPY